MVLLAAQGDWQRSPPSSITASICVGLISKVRRAEYRAIPLPSSKFLDILLLWSVSLRRSPVIRFRVHPRCFLELLLAPEFRGLSPQTTTQQRRNVILLFRPLYDSAGHMSTV